MPIQCYVDHRTRHRNAGPFTLVLCDQHKRRNAGPVWASITAASITCPSNPCSVDTARLKH